MKPNRKNEILTTLTRQGKVDVDRLAAEFSVTPQTIRRDLNTLVDAGLIARTYGGAKLVASTGASTYEARRMKNLSAKAAIAQAAATIVPDGASVALNIGTTTEQVARALMRHKDLTVISNNTNIIQIMRPAQLRSLIAIGGEVRPEDGAIVGGDAVAALANYKVDFAIIGTSALDPEGAALDFDVREVLVARAILENARQTILVADVSKFDVQAPNRICTLDALDTVVLNAAPPPEFCAAVKAAGTTLIIAEDPS
ncbi:MAG: DeoR/GlpR transcriptional regulator [Silicimonas sp.]|nr:DeoR/GlpR transcriptional regulator [Silicimonas sp.]